MAVEVLQISPHRPFLAIHGTYTHSRHAVALLTHFMMNFRNESSNVYHKWAYHKLVFLLSRVYPEKIYSHKINMLYMYPGAAYSLRESKTFTSGQNTHLITECKREEIIIRKLWEIYAGKWDMEKYLRNKNSHRWCSENLKVIIEIYWNCWKVFREDFSCPKYFWGFIFGTF